MEKNLMIFKNGQMKMLSIVCLVLMLGASCNNAEKKTESTFSGSTKAEGDTAKLAEQAANEEAQAINDATYYLKLKAGDLQTIFSYGSGNDVKQIYFDWTVVKKNYSLEVYGIDNAGHETQHYPLEIITTKNPVKNIKHLIRRPQLTYRGELKTFLNLATGSNTPIPPGQFKDMYFVAGVDQDPRHPGKNLMFLFYSDDLTKLSFETPKSGIHILGGGGATNPSPPAPPCTASCDD